MNKRVDEISRQALAELATAGWDLHPPPSFKYFTDKFALLIVRECATFVNNAMPVYSKDELDLCKRTAKQMKMYFGVE
jgi:hypothetical protein